MALLLASLTRLCTVSVAAVSLTFGSMAYLVAEAAAHIETPKLAVSRTVAPASTALPRLPAQAFDIAAAVPVAPDIPAELDQRSWPADTGSSTITLTAEAAPPAAAVTLEQGGWTDIGNGISVWERGSSEGWTLVGSAE